MFPPDPAATLRKRDTLSNKCSEPTATKARDEHQAFDARARMLRAVSSTIKSSWPAKKRKSRRASPTALSLARRDQTARKLSAEDLPVLGLGVTSKETFCPSLRLCIPARSTALMCTKTSLPPSSGWMKPKPFWLLNHFTVPCVISLVFQVMPHTGDVFPSGRIVSASLAGVKR